MPSGHPPIGGTKPKAAPSPWSEFADYTLELKAPLRGEASTWRFRAFADPADVIVDFDTVAPKGRTKGSILLVGGQAVATRGFTPEAGFELDALDIAIVNLKVLTELLDAALPAGPAALKASHAVSAKDDRAPIFVNTPGANAQFNAPWSLKGRLERRDANAVSFRLELEAPGGEKPGERSRWVFTGKASGSVKGRVMDDSMSLAGWTAYGLGPARPAKAQSHASLRFGATKLPGPFATLKDLRAALK
jgi:hypothetical protein